jgi:hypothetical protein
MQTPDEILENALHRARDSIGRSVIANEAIREKITYSEPRYEYCVRYMDPSGRFAAGAGSLESLGNAGWRLVHTLRIPNPQPYPWFLIFERIQGEFSGKTEETW